jgi:hypothetical protein
VTLLFAKYAREVAKALPSDQAYPLRGSEKRTARASNGLFLGLISGFVKVCGCRPHEGGAARTGGGVRKPPKEETAGGVSR